MCPDIEKRDFEIYPKYHAPSFEETIQTFAPLTVANMKHETDEVANGFIKLWNKLLQQLDTHLSNAYSETMKNMYKIKIVYQWNSMFMLIRRRGWTLCFILDICVEGNH